MATMPNLSRVPLVDPRTGMVAHDWARPISELFSGAIQSTSVDTATAAALAALTARVAALEARVTALEAAAGATTEADAVVLQPSQGPRGKQGPEGPQGAPGESAFPPPLHPIPLDWPEELRSLLELSGSY